MNLNDDIYIHILSFLKPNNICKECIENKEDLQTYINYCTVFNFKIKINICDYHTLKKQYDNLLNKIKSNIDNYKKERFSFHNLILIQKSKLDSKNTKTLNCFSNKRIYFDSFLFLFSCKRKL